MGTTEGKMSEAMWKALRAVEQGSYMVRSHRFPTLEALRKRGLVERYTTFVSRAWFADKDGEHKQHITPGKCHEWWLTPAGTMALRARHPGETP